MYRPLKTAHGCPSKYYLIDSDGNVIVKDDMSFILPVRTVTKGTKSYKQIQILSHGILRWHRVHRLVAYSWLPPPRHNCLKIVDHIDGNSLHNHVTNLRWVTTRGNNINRIARGEQGLVKDDEDCYSPKICGYVHTRFRTPNLETAQFLRKMIVEKYVRFNCRFPNKPFPHENICHM